MVHGFEVVVFGKSYALFPVGVSRVMSLVSGVVGQGCQVVVCQIMVGRVASIFGLDLAGLKRFLVVVKVV